MHVPEFYFAEHHLGGNIKVRYAICLGYKGRRAACPWVGLYNKHLPLFNCILYVYQPPDIQLQSNFPGYFCHLFHHQWPKVKYRQQRMAVATMYAGRLNVLHNTHDMNLLAVADRIDFCFLAPV